MKFLSTVWECPYCVLPLRIKQNLYANENPFGKANMAIWICKNCLKEFYEVLPITKEKET